MIKTGQKGIILLYLLIPLFVASCASMSSYSDENRLGDIKIGDSKNRVVQVLGEPEETDLYRTSRDESEVWIYYYDHLTPCPSERESYYYAPAMYLVFDNETVTSIFYPGAG